MVASDDSFSKMGPGQISRGEVALTFRVSANSSLSRKVKSEVAIFVGGSELVKKVKKFGLCLEA